MAAGVHLARFLDDAGVPGELKAVLVSATQAGAQIARELRKAGLSGVTGTAGGTNVHGEVVKKMDVLANEILVEVFRSEGGVAQVASEEMAEPLVLSREAPYSVLFDPLDGSSNVDTGGSVGTILCVQSSPGGKSPSGEMLLQKGADLAAACYLNYGPATSLVLATGAGAHLFCLEPGSETFVLITRDLKIPRRGKVYATNEGQRNYFHPSTRRFLDHLQASDPSDGRPYSTRYSGCLVTDVHRILLEGGIYLYPSDTRDPKKPHGKLRLLYECAPLAWIVEQAGGRASTGRGPIAEVTPSELHQRVPLFIGSPYEVGLAEEFEGGKR